MKPILKGFEEFLGSLHCVVCIRPSGISVIFAGTFGAIDPSELNIAAPDAILVRPLISDITL